MSMTTHSFSRVGRPLVYFIVSALMSVLKVCALDLDDLLEDSTVKSTVYWKYMQLILLLFLNHGDDVNGHKF